MEGEKKKVIIDDSSFVTILWIICHTICVFRIVVYIVKLACQA